VISLVLLLPVGTGPAPPEVLLVLLAVPNVDESVVDSDAVLLTASTTLAFTAG
jgi:hypothetical protein